MIPLATILLLKSMDIPQIRTARHTHHPLMMPGLVLNQKWNLLLFLRGRDTRRKKPAQWNRGVCLPAWRRMAFLLRHDQLHLKKHQKKLQQTCPHPPRRCRPHLPVAGFRVLYRTMSWRTAMGLVVDWTPPPAPGVWAGEETPPNVSSRTSQGATSHCPDTAQT